MRPGNEPLADGDSEVAAVRELIIGYQITQLLYFAL